MSYYPRSSVSIAGSSTVTGELSTVKMKPIVRVDTSYNLIPANFRTFTASSGSVSAQSKFIKVETGTSNGGYGNMQSFRTISYRAGNATLCRFDAAFDSGGVASSIQGAGMGSISDELSFGYDGTSFGTWFKHGGFAEVHTLTINTAETSDVTANVTVANVVYPVVLNSVVTATTDETATEIAFGLEANAAFAASWNAMQVDNTVIVTALTDTPKAQVFSYSSSGTSTGSFSQDTEAVPKTQTHTPVASWSETTSLTIQPNIINYYQIEFIQTGVAKFFIYDPLSSKFTLVHKHSLSSGVNSPGLTNPSMHTLLYAESTGSTTNLSIRTSSIAAFTEGSSDPIRNPRAFSSTQSITSSAFTSILAIRNRKTYNGIVNQIDVIPRRLFVSNNSTSKACIIEIRATTGSITTTNPTFVTTGNNLIVDVSTTSVVHSSGGRLLTSLVVGALSQTQIDLEKEAINIPPTLTLYVFAKMSSGTASDIDAAITWYEDI